jgi:hypothetical protein
MAPRTPKPTPKKLQKTPQKKESPKAPNKRAAAPTAPGGGKKAATPTVSSKAIVPAPDKKLGKQPGKQAAKQLIGATEKEKPVPLEQDRRLRSRSVVVRKGVDPNQKPRNQVEQGLCRVIGCTAPATTGGYSRACYIKYWKQIKQKDLILSEGTLQRYIRELCDKYPEKIIVAVRHDLASDDAYAQMIRDLDLYGGIDELEHAQSPQNALDDDEETENDLDSIKKGIDKEEDLF